jgi:cell division protease FtsH
MSEKLGMVQFTSRGNPYLGGYGDQRTFSEDTATTIDSEVQQIIGGSYDEAQRLLKAYRKQLDALAEALMDRETLDEKEILTVTGLSPASATDVKKRQNAHQDARQATKVP